jgi:hypothetical protein
MSSAEIGCLIGALLVLGIIFLVLAGTGLFDDWIE